MMREIELTFCMIDNIIICVVIICYTSVLWLLNFIAYI